MSAEGEISDIVWNIAMFNAAENIAKTSSAKTLCSMALVNKDWYNIATREKAKRYFIQHFPLNFDVEKQSTFPTVSNDLKVKPKISLLIYDQKLETLHRRWLRKNAANKPELDLGISLLDYFKRDLPNASLAMKFTEVLTSNSAELNCGLIGIFFPHIEKRNTITIATIPHRPPMDKPLDLGDWIDSSTRCLVRDLDLCNSINPKCCLLMWLQPNDPFATESVYRIKTSISRIQKGIDDTWIGELATLPTKACSHGKHPQNSKFLLVALKITGPNIVSCTATIDLSQPPEVVKSSLMEMSKKITLRRYRTGLISGPSRNERDPAYKNSQLIMNAVKEIFPAVPFVGLFGSHKNSPLCFSASPKELIKDGENTRRKVEYRSMSVIIITYD